MGYIGLNSTKSAAKESKKQVVSEVFKMEQGLSIGVQETLPQALPEPTGGFTRSEVKGVVDSITSQARIEHRAIYGLLYWALKEYCGFDVYARAKQDGTLKLDVVFRYGMSKEAMQILKSYAFLQSSWPKYQDIRKAYCPRKKETPTLPFPSEH